MLDSSDTADVRLPYVAAPTSSRAARRAASSAPVPRFRVVKDHLYDVLLLAGIEPGSMPA